MSNNEFIFSVTKLLKMRFAQLHLYGSVVTIHLLWEEAKDSLGERLMANKCLLLLFIQANCGQGSGAAHLSLSLAICYKISVPKITNSWLLKSNKNTAITIKYAKWFCRNMLFWHIAENFTQWLIDWLIYWTYRNCAIDVSNNNFSFDHLDTCLYQGPR